MGEVYFNLFLFIVSVAGLVNTFTWPVIQDTSGGPATYPRIILTALLLCSAVRMIQVLKQKKEDRPKFIFMNLFQGHRGFFLLALVIYVASLNVLGFMIATIVYLNVVVNVMIYFSKGVFVIDKWLFVRGGCFVGVAYGVTCFFHSALRVMVPTGIFGI